METSTSTITTRHITHGALSLRLSDRHAPSLVSVQDCSAAGPLQSRSMVLKGQRSPSPQLLRCKRRANLAGLSYALPQGQQQQQYLSSSVVRRNERERNRVRQVNAGFQTLRQHVPSGAANNGKLSKVETLRSAVEYIRALQHLLDEHDAVSAVFPSASGALSPSVTVSSGYSAGQGSPRSSGEEEEEEGVGYEHLSSEEHDLLDFTTWFNRC